MDNARTTRPNSNHPHFAAALPAQWPTQISIFEKQVYLASCAPTLVKIKPQIVRNLSRRQTTASLANYQWSVPLKDLYPTREQAVAATSEKFKDRLREANLRVARALLAYDDLLLRSLDFHASEGLAVPQVETVVSKTVDELKAVLREADAASRDEGVEDEDDEDDEDD